MNDTPRDWEMNEDLSAWEDQEEEELELVPAARAARRALCLGAVLMRGGFEVVIAGIGKKDAQAAQQAVLLHEQMNQHLMQWLEAEGLQTQLAESERILLTHGVGEWDDQDLIHVSRMPNALLPVLWALGHMEHLPAFDQPVDQRELITALPLLKETSEFVAGARLRSPEQIVLAREVAQLWMWRARVFQMQMDPEQYAPPQGAASHDEVVQAIARQAGERGLIQLHGDDFEALGKPYGQLSQAQWGALFYIARQRLYGLNWICGLADDWDGVPTDI